MKLQLWSTVPMNYFVSTHLWWILEVYGRLSLWLALPRDGAPNHFFAFGGDVIQKGHFCWRFGFQEQDRFYHQSFGVLNLQLGWIMTLAHVMATSATRFQYRVFHYPSPHARKQRETRNERDNLVFIYLHFEAMLLYRQVACGTPGAVEVGSTFGQRCCPVVPRLRGRVWGIWRSGRGEKREEKRKDRRGEGEPTHFKKFKKNVPVQNGFETSPKFGGSKIKTIEPTQVDEVSSRIFNIWYWNTDTYGGAS